MVAVKLEPPRIIKTNAERISDKEWEEMKKRTHELLKLGRGPFQVRQSGSLKGHFSFVRPKKGKVYQFSA
jgi:hypothetical protein